MTDLPLHLVSETATTITLGWTPPPGAQGYLFYADANKSSTGNGARSSVRFAKGAKAYRVQALGLLAEGVYPPPVVVPPPSDVLELAGTFTADSFKSAVDKAFAGKSALTVRPKPGAQILVTGNYGFHSGGTYEGDIIFDGELKAAECGMRDKVGVRILGPTFRNYYMGQGEPHSQGLAIWAGCRDIVVDAKFTDNGSTSHIFLSWYYDGSVKDWNNPSTWDTSRYPRDICIKGCEFGPSWGYYAIQFRSEIPASANIRFDPSNVLKPSSSLKPGQKNPEKYFPDQRFTKAC